MSKKLLGLFAGIVFAVSVMVVPVKAEIPDIGDLSKYSNDQLIEMILEMLAPGSSAGTDTTQTPQTGSSNWVSLGIPQGFQFNTNLKLGMTSNDVKYLQIMLNSDPDTAVAVTGAGSKGNETTYFGGLTQQAVVKFQEKYASTVLTPLGLTKGTGLAGAGTRVKLNEMLTQGVSDTPVDVSSLGMIECVTKGYKWDGTKCYTDEVVDVDVSSLGMIECVTKGYAWNGTKCYDPKAEDGETPVVKPVEGAGLEVALASDSPATSLVTGQSAAPLAKFVLTNKDAVEAKITRVELQRIGVSADATLANVYLFQGLTRLTDSAAISQGKIAFNNPNGIITVPAGSSVVLTVASDIDTGTSGQTIGISLNSVQSNVEVKALPVRGHVQTVADAELAKVTVGDVVPKSEDSVNAGTANYTVFQAPLTVSKRAVNLKAVTLKAIGSAPFDSFENVQLYVNGVEVGSPIVLTSEGMATFILDTPHEIQSGSAILEVRADIVKGSSRNFSFSLQNAADLIAVDTDYNVYTQVAGVPKTTALITINEGTVSVSQDSTFSATTVTGGVSNAVLAKYSFKAFGENVKVSYLDVESSVNLDNVSIYVNGAPVTSNVNYTGTKLHFSLGSSLIIPAGQTVSVEVRGDTKVNGEKLANAINIKMTLVPYTNNAQGVSSSKMITVPSIKTEGQELTVGSGELTISKRSGVTNSNISPNTDNQRIGAFTIQAGDSEAVRINNFNVNLTGSLKT
ncbi:MAG: peptidoglycan-binding domain-containing protein, partial [Candidatus Pacebacteria bacterium]|nr:peptidoglycan-binding domain-containing protein [Candidatus Paceibacterota bacterium]